MDEIARQMALLRFYLAWSQVKSQSLLERRKKDAQDPDRDSADPDDSDEFLRVGHC